MKASTPFFFLLGLSFAQCMAIQFLKDYRLDSLVTLDTWVIIAVLSFGFAMVLNRLDR